MRYGVHFNDQMHFLISADGETRYAFLSGKHINGNYFQQNVCHRIRGFGSCVFSLFTGRRINAGKRSPPSPIRMTRYYFVGQFGQSSNAENRLANATKLTSANRAEERAVKRCHRFLRLKPRRRFPGTWTWLPVCVCARFNVNRFNGLKTKNPRAFYWSLRFRSNANSKNWSRSRTMLCNGRDNRSR